MTVHKNRSKILISNYYRYFIEYICIYKWQGHLSETFKHKTSLDANVVE